MLILSAISSPLHCHFIIGSLAIAGLFNGNSFTQKLENRRMGKLNAISANLGDRVFRLIQSESYLETYIHSGRYRRSSKPT